MSTIQPLYSHRQRASLPRDIEAIEEPAWVSIRELILLSLRRGNFAEEFPTICSNCRNVFKTNEASFESNLKIAIPRFDWFALASKVGLPDTATIYDLIEFSYAIISFAEPRPNNRNFCRHRMFITFDRERGQRSFRSDVNRIFDSERIGYELTEDGLIARVGAPILSETISETRFITGDVQLADMLETACDKFISREPAVRREGLEKLWDAWERLKTLEVPSDKRASTSALLDRVAAGPMRELLETEARELTDIGNQFMIRHSETDRHPLDDDRHVDYLFHRLFSLVYLLMDATGRVGRSG